MMLKTVPLAFALSLSMQSPAAPAAQVPAPSGATPAACAKEVRDYAARRRAEVPPIPTANFAGDAGTQTPATLQAAQAAASQKRTALFRQIEADRLDMAKACAAKFDVTTAPENTLADLASLYSDAAQPDKARAAIDRAVAAKTMSEADRANLLGLAIQIGLTEPKGDERNARLEGLSDQLDKIAVNVAFTQQWKAHESLEDYYRYDDIDAGIIKHATWIIDTVTRFRPEDRTKYALAAVRAYVNMAEAWAGEGMNDQAIALLRRAEKELPGAPDVVRSVEPEIARLQLVGTVAAPLTAPHWLNMPAGQTTLDLKGHVTLLEFSAHWCVPCKESYPGVNRLRATYGPNGFQSVIATQLWGYFQTERPLDAAAEIDRDKTYFAEHGLDVPIAIGDKTPPAVRNADGSITPNRDPNDANFRVGGIPQIMLIDKQGKIRLLMVGYDDANEAKLAKMIEAMLKEQ